MSQQSRLPRARGRPKKRTRRNSTPSTSNIQQSEIGENSVTMKLVDFLDDTGLLEHPTELFDIQNEKVENADVKRMIKLWKHSMELKVNLY
jgi:hypothetical protein